MKSLNLKILIVMLAVFSANITFSQTIPFEGQLVYVQKAVNAFSSEIKYTEYHHHGNVLLDMPQMKTRLLYREDLGMLISIQGMMGTPLISKKFVEKGSDSTLLQFGEQTENVHGYHCLKVISEVSNGMMQGTSTVWIDTSYKIPYNYSLNSNLPYGLVVRTESEINLKGIKTQTVRELIDIRFGEVDASYFAIPNEDSAIVVSQNMEGQIVYRDIDSFKIQRMISNSSNHLEELDANTFDKKTQKGYVLVDFGAVWCGPCRLLGPKLEEISQKYKRRLRVFKVDIDQASDIAERYNVTVVPTVIMFKDGIEINRFVGGNPSVDEISHWIEQQIE